MQQSTVSGEHSSSLFRFIGEIYAALAGGSQLRHEDWTSFVASFVWREGSSVMDKLKEIENEISENDFKKIDELKDCLQR